MKRRFYCGLAALMLMAMMLVPWKPAAAESGATASFTGMWESPESGTVALYQMVNQVFGIYIWNDGQIEGTVEGQTLTFRWWEGTAFGDPYESADPAIRGDGYFTITEDGAGFVGAWRREGVPEWEGWWTGDLVLTDFTGSWNSYELGLLQFTQEAGNVVGTYAYNGGQIEGAVEGRQLNFRWWEFTAEGDPYESADPGNRGDGYVTISGDGQTLTGGWRYEGEEDWREFWPIELVIRE